MRIKTNKHLNNKETNNFKSMDHDNRVQRYNCTRQGKSIKIYKTKSNDFVLLRFKSFMLQMCLVIFIIILMDFSQHFVSLYLHKLEKTKRIREASLLFRNLPHCKNSEQNNYFIRNGFKDCEKAKTILSKGYHYKALSECISYYAWKFKLLLILLPIILYGASVFISFFLKIKKILK